MDFQSRQYCFLTPQDTKVDANHLITVHKYVFKRLVLPYAYFLHLLKYFSDWKPQSTKHVSLLFRCWTIADFLNLFFVLQFSLIYFR